MARISDDDLNRLKRNTSLADLCRSRGIELKRHGRKDLIGKCPFHEDDTPSFVVSPEKNLFHCMGCDAAGSVVDFVMKADGLDFKQAVEHLMPGLRGNHREVTMVPNKAEASAAEMEKPGIPPERVAQLLERVVTLYAKAFAEAPEYPNMPEGFASAGRSYLERRGITDAGLFTRHRLGYAYGLLPGLLPKDGALNDELKALGVLLDQSQERFKDCVVFPVIDADGRIVTLYGRKIADPNNTEPITENQKCRRHFFLPGRPTGLWNAVAMKTYPELILVESVIDALSVMMAGHHNVLAIQGTNGLSEADAAQMKAYGVQSVTLLLDGDEAGAKAAARLRPRLEALGLAVTVKALPEQDDPNSFLVKHGPQVLAAFLASPNNEQQITSHCVLPAESGVTLPEVRATGGDERTPPPLQSGVTCPPSPPSVLSPPPSVVSPPSSVLSFGLRKYRVMGLEKGPRKLKATLRVEHAGKLHVDTLDFYSAKSRRVLAMDLCRLFEETPETIEADLDKLLRHCEAMPEGQPAEDGGQKTAEERMSAAERKEAEAFGQSPGLFEEILADCERRGLMGEGNNVHLLYAAMSSRKRETPLSVLILSSSGSGKTALQDAVLAFCPPEDLVKLTSLSGRALFYKDRLSLKHKVLALEEGDGAQEAMYAIRNLISAGELVSESTIKDIATGRLTTMENRVEGPSSVCFTTTKPDVDPETKSRFWVTSIDESRDQTRKILDFQRRLHLSDGLITTPETEAVLRKHRNFQRLLKPLAVKNPYAAQLTYGDDRLQGRRDQPKYLNLIKAIAFLRQMQKTVFQELRDGVAIPYINVEPADITLANRLSHDLLGHSLDELSRPGHDLLLHLDGMARDRVKILVADNPESKLKPTDLSFSRRDIREFTGWTNTRLHIHLKELVDFEYVIIETGRNGLPFRYRLAWDGQGKDGKRFMLGLTDPALLAASQYDGGME